MGSSYIVLSLSVALTLLGLKFLYSGKWRKRALLPPGPPGRFFIGNLREFKSVHRWKVFTKWQELYGKCSMVYIKVLGRPIVILNDFESATEILTKQSMSTAGRPRLVMACELMGFDTATAPSQPNAFHKSMRRQMVPALNARTCADRHPIEVDERDTLLQRLESRPQEFIQHLRQAVGSVVLRFSYGHRVLEDYDPLVELINQSLASVSVPLSGTYLVDVLPFLKYIPEWFPGARFKVQAREWAELRKQSIEVPFQEVRRSMEAGIVKPSFLQRLLEKRSSLNDWDSEEVQSMKYAAGSLYSAGSDTTVSALSTFLLAMTLFPEKQRKAQLELDRVLGRGRVPDFQDQESLPYVSSLIKEVLRWYPVLPLAIAHTCTEDITHNGYLISKGTTLVPNVWAMSRDASVYPAPDEFLPERFLPRSIGGLHDIPARDPAEFIFGFGRRLCPGRMLATESLWLFAASILAVFDIAPPMDDKTGHPIVPQGTYGNGAIVHPDPFKCDIKRRQQVPNA